jgi:hypothetical protein
VYKSHDLSFVGTGHPIRIKSHIKYKVSISEKKGDSVYIIRMHDKDTCVCSKNPNAEFTSNKQYILISMQEIMGKQLLEE